MKLSKLAQASLFAVAIGAAFQVSAANIVASSSVPFLLNGQAYTFTGTGSFAYTSNKKSNDNMAGIKITGVGGAVYTTTTVASGLTVAQEATLILDDAGHILGSASTGGEHQAAPAGMLMDGGTLDVTNLGYDPVTNKMYADVYGVDAGGVAHTASHLDFFQVGSFSGATQITGEGTFTQTMANLSLTTAGLGIITDTLGLGGLAESVTGSTTFGTITAKFVVAKAAVPEASTMAMMLLGLGGLAGLRLGARSGVRRQA